MMSVREVRDVETGIRQQIDEFDRSFCKRTMEVHRLPLFILIFQCISVVDTMPQVVVQTANGAGAPLVQRSLSRPDQLKIMHNSGAPTSGTPDRMVCSQI
jgi:hypothetical protein